MQKFKIEIYLLVAALIDTWRGFSVPTIRKIFKVHDHTAAQTIDCI